MLDAVLEYLKLRTVPFLLTGLSDSEEVMSAVWEGVKRRGVKVGEGEGEGVVRREEVYRELCATVKNLQPMGLVIPTTPWLPKSQVHYEVSSVLLW